MTTMKRDVATQDDVKELMVDILSGQDLQIGKVQPMKATKPKGYRKSTEAEKEKAKEVPAYVKQMAGNAMTADKISWIS